MASLGDVYTSAGGGGDGGHPGSDASTGDAVVIGPDSSSRPDGGVVEGGGPFRCETVDADFCCDFDRTIVEVAQMRGPCLFSSSVRNYGDFDQLAPDGAAWAGGSSPGVVTCKTDPVGDAGPRAESYLSHSYGGGFQGLHADFTVRRDDGTQLAGVTSLPVIAMLYFPNNGAYAIELYVLSQVIYVSENGATGTSTGISMSPHQTQRLHVDVTFTTSGTGTATVLADDGTGKAVPLKVVPRPPPSDGELHVGLFVDAVGPSGAWKFTYDDVLFDVVR